MAVEPMASAVAAPATDPAATPAVAYKLDIILRLRIWRGGLGIVENVGSVKNVVGVEFIWSVKIGKAGRGGEGSWRDCNQGCGLAR
jgi:hypothetical protein